MPVAWNHWFRMALFFGSLRITSCAEHLLSTVTKSSRHHGHTRLAFQSGLQVSKVFRRFLPRDEGFFPSWQPPHRLVVDERAPSFDGLWDNSRLVVSSSTAPPTSTGLFLARGRSERDKRNSSPSSSNNNNKMPKGIKKENLPTKVCVTCGRPFTWRKKWEKVWDEVTTCSKSCNAKRRQAKRSSGVKTEGEVDPHDHDDDDDDNDNDFQGKQKNSGRKATKSRMSMMENLDTNSIATDAGKQEEHLSAELKVLLAVSGTDNDDEHDREGHLVSLAAASDESYDDDDSEKDDPVARQKAERKAAKKAMKAKKRAHLEGRGDPTAGQKQCHMCSQSIDLLIRCMYEEGQTDWSMVCGKCWKVASGGVVDGDEHHPHYRYGGLWKNRRRTPLLQS
jgi:hypothetical protein